MNVHVYVYTYTHMITHCPLRASSRSDGQKKSLILIRNADITSLEGWREEAVVSHSDTHYTTCKTDTYKRLRIWTMPENYRVIMKSTIFTSLNSTRWIPRYPRGKLTFCYYPSSGQLCSLGPSLNKGKKSITLLTKVVGKLCKSCHESPAEEFP